MLFELLRQHNGGNNGHLQLSVKWLKKRGWTSTDQIQKAKTELIERCLVIKTRFGGMGMGPDRYALTWLAISQFQGLDVRSSEYHPGAWRWLDTPLLHKRDDRSDVRNQAIPSGGIKPEYDVPRHGTSEAAFRGTSVPSSGNNECCQLPHANAGSRVVGKKGRSGIKRASGSHTVYASPDT